MTPPPLLIDTVAVSALTGIAAETLRQWRREGRGPRCTKIGKRWAYRPADVELWIDQQFTLRSAGEALPRCSGCLDLDAAAAAGSNVPRTCPVCEREWQPLPAPTEV